MLVKTRFAPSPTGTLHVGSVRTALFSWLFARHHQGTFVLRIEDTDQERSTDASVEAILQGMAWLGLTYDEEPIFQSKRYARYEKMAEQLLSEGKAYRCVCSKERLEALRTAQIQAKEKPRYDGHCRRRTEPVGDRPFVIRFKTPEVGGVSFRDQVYGDIHIENSELDDLVLIRSDGQPTYNFAVVIDDWDMAITHVIRGDDHINNTPRQIHLCQALNAPIPIYAHLPMILGDDGKRLSKRHGAVNVMQFKEMGFLPHALLNYLVRLGWSSADQEIFSEEEMIAAFDLRHVSRGGASFNYEKLLWLNQHYQKTDSPDAVANALAWHFEEQGIVLEGGPSLVDLVKVQAERCKTLSEICEKSRYFYQDVIVYDEDAVEKQVPPALLEPLTLLYRRFIELIVWDKAALHQCLQEVSETLGVSLGKIAQPLRVIVTGSSMSPSIDVTLALLGKTRTLSRLQRILKRFT